MFARRRRHDHECIAACAAGHRARVRADACRSRWFAAIDEVASFSGKRGIRGHFDHEPAPVVSLGTMRSSPALLAPIRPALALGGRCAAACHHHGRRSWAACGACRDARLRLARRAHSRAFAQPRAFALQHAKKFLKNSCFFGCVARCHRRVLDISQRMKMPASVALARPQVVRYRDQSGSAYERRRERRVTTTAHGALPFRKAGRGYSGKVCPRYTSYSWAPLSRSIVRRTSVGLVDWLRSMSVW